MPRSDRLSGKPSQAWRLWIVVLFAVGLAVLLFLCRMALIRQPPPVGLPAGPFKWSVGDILPRVPHPRAKVVAGFYCNSCSSGTCRQRCLALKEEGKVVGMHNRFFWCEVMVRPGVYDLRPVLSWVKANADVGLRSVIGFTAKTDRGRIGRAFRQCSPVSDGSPQWMLRPGSPYDPLNNNGYYHLNYADPDVQTELRGLLEELHRRLLLPENVPLLENIDSFEVDIGHDGELDAARNVKSLAGDPTRCDRGDWCDAEMYKCVYGGGAWDGARQRCSGGDEAAASALWRDTVVKPFIDIYGQELGDLKPLTLMVTGQLVWAGERAQPCKAPGCSGRNVVDYAWEEYGIGVKTTGVNPDFGKGNGRDDIPGEEYVNWPNIFKLTWPERLATGEHGISQLQDRPGNTALCCDTPQEFYWAVLNALDKHLAQLHFNDRHMREYGVDEAFALFQRYAGRSIFDTPDVWIVFRDTAPEPDPFYPDGTAVSSRDGRVNPNGGPPPCCRHLPNYEWFVYQMNPHPAQMVWSGLPDDYRSLSARGTQAGPLLLDIDDLWPQAGQLPSAAGGCASYDVTIDYLDQGTDSFDLRYSTQDSDASGAGAGLRRVQKSNSGQWRSVTLHLIDAYFSNAISSGPDLALVNSSGGDDVFHRVRVSYSDTCQARATVTPVTTPTLTVTPTLTASPTPTPTPQRGRPLAEVITLILQPDGIHYDGVSDTYLSSYPGQQASNFGLYDSLVVRPSAEDHVSLLRFDLQRLLPDDAVVQQAILELFVRSRTNVNPLRVAVYPLRRPWQETEANWLQAGAGDPWTAAGAQGEADRDPSPIDQQIIATVNDWAHFDVTQAVADWVSGQRENNGLALVGQQISGQVMVRFTSSNGTTPKFRPRLIINYVQPPQPLVFRVWLPLILMPYPPPPTPTPSPTATASPTPTQTPSPSPTATATPTPSATLTRTPSPSPTSTSTPSSTATFSATPTPSPSATSTRGPAWTATPTSTATASPTPSPTPTATLTASPSPTQTLTATPTASPTATAGQPETCLPQLLTTVSPGDAPKGLAADDQQVYVALYENSRLAIVDAAQGRLKSISSLASGHVNGIAVLGNRVYTANRDTARLSVSRADNGLLLKTIAVGRLPWGVSAADERVYVVNFADSAVAVIDATRDQVLSTVPVAPLPAFVAARSDQAYVTHLGGELSVVGRAGTLLAQVRPGPSDLWGIAISPDGNLLYLGSRSEQRIVVLNTEDLTGVNAIPLPGPPYALAVNPRTGHLFAVDASRDVIYVVDTAAGYRLLGEVPVGHQGLVDGGQGIAVAQNRVYVGNWLAHSLTVLDDGACQP